MAKRKNKEKEKANEILLGVEPMLISMLNNYNGLTVEEKEDFKQECMFFIWQKVIPVYRDDISKISTFIYVCSRNFFNKHISRYIKKDILRKSIDVDNNPVVNSMEYNDSKKESIIKTKYLMERSVEIFTPKQQKVFYLMIHFPELTCRELAEILGYKNASSISMTVARMRKKVKKMKIPSEYEDMCDFSLYFG